MRVRMLHHSDPDGMYTVHDEQTKSNQDQDHTKDQYKLRDSLPCSAEDKCSQDSGQDKTGCRDIQKRGGSGETA